MSQAMDQTQNLEALTRPAPPPQRRVPDPAAHAANDLANLLAAMKGQAQLACDDPSGEEKDELVRVVLSASLKAEAILQRMQNVGPPPTLEPSLRPSAAPPGSAHILVADDESAVRVLLERVLRKEGYQVTSAVSGADALACCEQHSFDLAFLDVQLGDMMGTDVYRQIAPLYPETHVIFLSGDPNAAAEVGAATTLQPAVFIRKPFDIGEIRQRVHSILSMKSALT